MHARYQNGPPYICNRPFAHLTHQRRSFACNTNH